MSDAQSVARFRGYRLMVLLARPLVLLLFRPRVRGLGNVPAGGFVLSANHLSGWDVVALGYPLPRRWLRHMAKTQLFERRLLGPLARFLGAFPAGGGEGAAVGTAARLARAGHVVVIMPEGARRRRDRTYRPRKGAAHAALAADVPLVPAALRGMDRWRRLARWDIAFGAPIELEDLRERDSHEAATIATERLWSAIQALEAGLGAPEARAASSRSSAE